MNKAVINLPKPFFVLAPMDDVTDTVFRQIIADCSPPDLYFTEFVNVDGLQSPGRQKLIKKLQITDREKPIIAQLWGKNPDNFYKTAGELKAMGFAGIDLNMGCPVKAIVKNGCCAALINNRELALDIINATKTGAQGTLPISIKTRLGFSAIDYEWPKILLEQKIDMLTVHGRTAKELSKVPANWPAIGAVVKLRNKMSPNTKIVGNGDVTSLGQGLELIKRYGLDGIMIGRGVFNDPYVFSKNSPWVEMTKKEKIELFMKHVKLFKHTWRDNPRPVRVLNKFCKIYIQNFDGAKELRELCMSCESSDKLLSILDLALLQ